MTVPILLLEEDVDKTKLHKSVEHLVNTYITYVKYPEDRDKEKIYSRFPDNF